MGFFEWIRDHKRLMLGALIVLIFPSFVFWGISGYDQFIGDGAQVAEVHGQAITRDRFENAHREQLDQVRRIAAMGGQSLDTASLDNPGLRQEVLDRLIQEALLQRQVVDRRIYVSDLRLRDEIGNIPNLRQPDGTFNLEQYKSLLAAQGKTEFQFEQALRQDLALRTLPDALAASGLLPSASLKAIVAAQLEKREIRYRWFKATQYKDELKPSEAQIEAFFKKEAKRFEQAAIADIEVLTLSANDLIAKETADEESVRTFYEQNPPRFGEPEQRRASHILLELAPSASEAAKAKVLVQARSLIESLRDGKDFAALAKQWSKDSGSASQGGDLGFFSREAMVKPFADAVFAMKAGAISEPVVSEFGVHVIKLTDISPAKLKPFAQVRNDIERLLKQEKAQKRFAALAETFSNTVYEQSDNLQAAASKIDQATQIVKSVRADGRIQSAQSKPGDRANIDPRVLRAVFSEESIRLRRNTDALEIAPGVLVSARLSHYQPPQSPPLEAVRSAVVAQWTLQAAEDRAKEEGEKFIEALGRKIEDAGNEKPKAVNMDQVPAIASLLSSFSAPITVSRGQSQNLDADSTVAAFKLRSTGKQRLGGVRIANEGFRVMLLVKVIPADEAQINASVPLIRQQLASLEGRFLSDQYLKHLRSQASVKTYPNRIAQSPAKS